ncbi:MAG: type II toxin-antitoxin system RelB/DinJ family antitoxin [Lewinellaceae bacterium]|nr:type II toxin-antitoxin system RelB/DinJ family antitoxin [Lewinellaceae bacterium]
MSDIRVIVPDSLKADVRSILKQQDLTLSQAVRLFFREIVEHGGLPFAAGHGQPNATTLAAMKASQNPANLKTYSSADEMFASWDADE